MDRRRLREFKVRAREHTLGVANDEELTFAEGLFERCEKQGETVYPLLIRRFERYERLLALTRDLNQEQRLERLLGKIVDAAIELCGAERGVLILADSDTFQQQVARRFGGEDLQRLDLQFSRTIAAKVIQEDRLIQLEDALADRELAQNPSIQQMKLRSIMAVPLRGRQAVLGALYVDNRFAQGVFGQDSTAVLQTLADQASIAIENARLHEADASHNDSLEVKLTQMSGIVVNQRQQLAGRKADFHQIIGRSAPMQVIFREIEKISQAPISILIQGESGSGKELVARAVHQASPRREGPFISENCAAIPESLAESELFGHLAGAFTGAERDKKGLFELAQGGTLFLDEVADMSDQLQKKLLRVLQEGEVRPIGAKEPIQLDVRIISAANQRLESLVEDGQFRQDLFFRLKGHMICLPPLRQRCEDIPLLVEHFLDGRSVTREAMDLLLAYAWPGNVRELSNECQAMCALSDGTIGVEQLSAVVRGQASGRPHELKDIRPLEALVEAVEREALVRAVALSRNKTEAAQRLEISRYTLNRKLEKYGLDS